MRRLLPAMVIGLVAAACGSGAESPPDLSLGRDVCDRCGMIISEARFAAAYWVGDENWLFDDIGGMLVFADMAGDIDRMSAWVHDYDSEEWINAEDAFYVMESSIQTPMDFGVAAFADRSRADSFAAEHSTSAVSWVALVDKAKVGEIEPSGRHLHADEAVDEETGS